MRIKKLHLTRYGKFTDFTLNFGERKLGESDFHVVYGLNEAGKSTTFTAWLDFLFGMGKGNSYNFLHDYGAMNIGACIETGDHVFDLQRIKANKNSLLDASDNPFSELALLTNMAGLDRDSYRAMFSLDDDSLEKGGNEILNSKGDLGEILFSATAGLDGVSQKLAEIEKNADAIYRPRAPSTAILQYKKQLTDLKNQSHEIDVAASQYKRLVKEKREAEDNYNLKSVVVLEKSNEIDSLNRQIDLRKRLKTYAEIAQNLSNFDGFPMPPKHWRDEMGAIWQNDSALNEKKKSKANQIENLKNKFEESQFEPELIKLSDTIALLDNTPKSRYITAKDDIEKRKDELISKKTDLAALILQFNQPSRSLNELLIDKAQLAPLKTLLQKKPLIDSQIVNATNELQAAEKALYEVETRYDSNSPSFDNEAVLLLETKLTELSDKGLIAESQSLEATIASLQSKQTHAFSLLKPFRGTMDDLNALIINDKDYWSEQYHALQRLNQQLDNFTLEKRQIADKLANIETRIATLKKQSNLVDSETLKDFNEEKLIAWQNHYRKLDAESANQFALAMQHYDDAMNSRLNHFERIAHLEQAKIDWQETKKNQENIDAAIQQKQSEIADIAKYISQSLNKIGINEDMPNMAAIQFLQDWLIKRTSLQAISDELNVAHGRYSNVQSIISQIHKDISQILPTQRDDIDAKALIALAKKYIENQTELKHQKSEGERALKKGKSDLEERQKTLKQFLNHKEQWQSQWHDALKDLWLADISSLDTISYYIEKLELLPELKQQCDNLEHRISAMEKDMAKFYNEVISLYLIAENNFDEKSIQDPLIAFNALQAKVNDAVQKANQNKKAQSELQELEKQYQQTITDITIHNDIIKQRFAFFSGTNFEVDNLNDLARNLDLAHELAEKKLQLAKCESEIKIDYYCDDITAAFDAIDLDGAEIDIISLSELKFAMQPLNADKEQAYALFDEKRKQLDAIGGDDKVALIASQQQTIRLEIEELALKYLKLKTGWKLAQEALVQYRDRHRSSMLKRASEAFKEITSGHYSGLTTQLNGSEEVLIAITKDGKSKLPSALSKGTCFQLYLALRFAGYQEFAQNHEPIPFIADDIMETFDEPRASEALRLMGMMAKTGQVIYLTHHRHICDLALASADNVTIHNLPS